MGRISSVHRSDGPPLEGPGIADAAHRLRSHGAMAGVDGSAYNGNRHLSSLQARQSDCHRQLTSLLSPLHHDPSGLASRLLHRFGSIARITNASEAELRQVCAVGEGWVEALLGVRELIHHGTREHLIRTRLGKDRSALMSYLLMTMRNLDEERMLAIFADAAGFVITEEVLAEGDESKVLITPRQVFGRALKIDARRILLAHNHPSGDANPSPRDIEHTRILCQQAEGLGLIIEDHLIIGSRQVVSMKDRRLI